ncbi:Hypothetical predicted protein, partial [Pelobates cultripes]
ECRSAQATALQAARGGGAAKNAGKRCAAGRGGEQSRADPHPPSDETQYLRTASPKHPHHTSVTALDQRDGREENGKCQSRAQEDRGETSSIETAGQAKKPQGPGKDNQK